MKTHRPQHYLKIRGGLPLQGEVCVSGAKNSALPLLFASLLANGEHEFHNVPKLKDVQSALKMLSSLGLVYESSSGKVRLKNEGYVGESPCPESAQSFRAGILCLGPLLARFGQVKLPLPGGCDIGSRPIDIHLRGLRLMGAKIVVEEGIIHASAPKKLKAGEIKLKFPSVGATENLIMASTLAEGTSYLKNIACEPEILELINYLKSLGAQIEKKALRELKITGTPELKSCGRPYKIVPDRIEAGTWLIAGACTKGELLIKSCRPELMTSLLEKLKAVGFVIKTSPSEIFLKKNGRNHPAMSVQTGVYPDFPTDLQSQLMALMTQLKGVSSLEETVFENRFRYVEQLNLLGSCISVKGRKAFVQGPVVLKGHDMRATDLRAGAGLALAGLLAEGESRISGLHHIERGYESFYLKLKSLSANVELYDGGNGF